MKENNLLNTLTTGRCHPKRRRIAPASGPYILKRGFDLVNIPVVSVTTATSGRSQYYGGYRL